MQQRKRQARLAKDTKSQVFAQSTDDKGKEARLWFNVFLTFHVNDAFRYTYPIVN